MNCTHIWPDELTPDATCLDECGLAYSEWTDMDNGDAMDTSLQRDNQRRAELNRAARDGRNSADPRERAKWLNRDEYLGRLS